MITQEAQIYRVQGSSSELDGKIREQFLAFNTQTNRLQYSTSGLTWVTFSNTDQIDTQITEVRDMVVSATENLSTGCVDITLPGFEDQGDGTAFFNEMHVAICSGANYTGGFKKYVVLEDYLTFPGDVESYVCVDYNAGEPRYVVLTDKSLINGSSIILLYTFWRQGLTLHSCGYDSLGLGLSNKIESYIRNTHKYDKSNDGGLVLSEDGSRHILVTSAVVYSSVVPQTVGAYNSSTDVLTLVDGNNYTNQNQYDNTNYAGGTLTNNKFGVRWFFRSIGDALQVFYVLGSAEYNNVEDAKLETIPTVNTLLRNHCVLIGRIIIQKGAASGLVENVSDVSFTTSQVQNHNDLQNIQGGIVGEYYHLTSSQYNSLSNLSALQEPTGFADKNQSMTYNFSTKTFNISAVGGFDFFYRGQKFSKTSDSLTITATGRSFIFYTSAGILTATYDPWDISTTVQVAYLNQSNDQLIMFGEERHGTVMDWATHQHFHNNFGTLYTEGFEDTFLINNDNVSIALTNGKISDEDLVHSISHGTSGGYFTQPLATSAQIPVYYYTTAAPGDRWIKVGATNLPYHGASNQVYYSPNNNGVAFVTNNYFVSYYIFATNNIAEPIISIMGQRQDTSIGDAQVNQVPESLTFTDLPSIEMKLLYQIILNTQTSYTGNPFRVRIQQVNDFRNQKTNNISLTSTGAYLPLTGGTLTGQLNGVNGSFTGAVDGGNSRIQTDAVANGAWFGYAGKNTPGAYIGYYATSAGSLRIASQSTQTVTIGTGENYGALVVNTSGISVLGDVYQNTYRTPYVLFSSAYAISGLVGGTNRMILNVTIPAGLLNTRRLRVTFTYGISNAGAHTAYLSASFGGQVFNDSTMGLGNTGDFDGKYTLQIDSLVKGASGLFSIDSCAQGKFGPTPTHIHSQQNYIGTEFSAINLNNAQNLSILIDDNSAASTIYILQPLIEVL